MDKKIRPSYTMSTRDLLQLERYTEAKRKDGKSYFIKMKTNKKKRKAGVAIFIPDKINFKTKAITRDKEGPNNSTSGYLSQKTQNTN